MPGHPSRTMDELIAIAERLTGTFLRSHPIEYVETQLKDLIEGYRPYGISLFPQHTWFRIVSSGPEGHSNIKRALYHEGGAPAFGRANFPGDKVVYASDNEKVCFDEMGASVGDHFHLVRFAVNPELEPKALVLGVISSFYHSAHAYYAGALLDPALMNACRADSVGFKKSAFVESVISEMYRRPYKRPYEYKVTALFNRLLAERGGIIYPSVESSHGINIALPASIFDQSCEILSTHVLRIDSSANYGFYEFTMLKHSHDIAKDGTIEWQTSTMEDRKVWGAATPRITLGPRS
ncbi:MAG: hypothetical protein JWQ01_3088 [Massilia sp.]|nr:hypothetical protein [Massilia sp.]